MLVLGGTWFLGRALTFVALQERWQVTAFTRGRSGTPAKGVRHVIGDRTSAADLARLRSEGPWDATIDTSAYEPGDVQAVLQALGPAVGRYVLVSTVSAYRDWPARPVDETSRRWPSRPDAAEADHDVAALSVAAQYGTLKAGCELVAEQASGCPVILRPGVILGPGEYVGRMAALLDRAARGGQWLLPGPRERSVQPVDVRDVARFAVDLVTTGSSGVYNTTAPPGFATYGQLIDACIDSTGGRAEPVWADPVWLETQGVQQWTEIPLWRTAPGTWAVDSAKAADAGLQCRPLAETVHDTRTSFARAGPVPHPRQAEHGLAAEREAELLTTWAAR